MAILDLAMLAMTLQYSFLVANHFLLTKSYKNAPTRIFATYTWNVVCPMQSAFAIASDFVVVAMTINRFFSSSAYCIVCHHYITCTKLILEYLPVGFW